MTTICKDCDQYLIELAASRAECERLREALQAAVTTETLYQRPFAISGPWLERARAALQGDV